MVSHGRLGSSGTIHTDFRIPYPAPLPAFWGGVFPGSVLLVWLEDKSVLPATESASAKQWEKRTHRAPCSPRLLGTALLLVLAWGRAGKSVGSAQHSCFSFLSGVPSVGWGCGQKSKASGQFYRPYSDLGSLFPRVHNEKRCGSSWWSLSQPRLEPLEW